MSRAEARINADPVVQELARALGVRLRLSESLKNEVVKRAIGKVEDWFGETGIEPETLADVQALVRNRTRMRVQRIETDADFEAAKAVIPTGVPVQLEMEFQRGTEAVVVRRDSVDRLGAKYVAVIDARGENARRAWFGERHEGAHLIVPDSSAQVVWRRTREERPEPLEQVIDAIASGVGFWAPIVRRQLTASMSDGVNLLDAFEHAHAMLCPDASRQAAFAAFLRYVDRPAVVIWTKFGASKQEDRSPLESFALRVGHVHCNAPAVARGLRVWKNFRIPPDSIITVAYSDQTHTRVDEDNLARWPTDSGKGLINFPVIISARGHWAIIAAK